MIKRYRKNVAVVVINDTGHLLACQRSDVRGAWQLVQGGVEPGESDETAMYRELEEEIGTRDVELLARLPDPIRYDWPESLFDRGYHGQEQSYFLVRVKEGQAIDLTRASAAEFSQVEWVTVAEFFSRIDGFKAEAYRTAILQFLNSHPGLMRERDD